MPPMIVGGWFWCWILFSGLKIRMLNCILRSKCTSRAYFLHPKTLRSGIQALSNDVGELPRQKNAKPTSTMLTWWPAYCDHVLAAIPKIRASVADMLLINRHWFASERKCVSRICKMINPMSIIIASFFIAVTSVWWLPRTRWIVQTRILLSSLRGRGYSLPTCGTDILCGKGRGRNRLSNEIRTYLKRSIFFVLMNGTVSSLHR